MSQLAMFAPAEPERRQQPTVASRPRGWSPDELPEPAATAAREEPTLARLAALTTVHRLHGTDGTTVTRGRKAGLAYLEQRALQMTLARAAKATPAQEPETTETESEEQDG